MTELMNLRGKSKDSKYHIIRTKAMEVDDMMKVSELCIMFQATNSTFLDQILLISSR